MPTVSSFGPGIFPRLDDGQTTANTLTYSGSGGIVSSSGPIATQTGVFGSGTPLPGAVVNATELVVGGTTQINVQNTSSDNAASTDVICTSSDGTNSTGYIDIGINSPTYNQVSFNTGGADDGYLFVVGGTAANGGNLFIGTATAGKSVTIGAGGTQVGNVVETLSSTAITMAVPLAPTSGITGLVAGAAASAGIVGEVIQSTVLIGAATSLTNATPKNVTSIALTAGDWDVQGQVTLIYASASMVAGSLQEVGINSTSATLPVDGSESYEPIQNAIVTTSYNQTINISRKVINIAAGATEYLVAVATFTAGTVSAYGNITARRMR